MPHSHPKHLNTFLATFQSPHQQKRVHSLPAQAHPRRRTAWKNRRLTTTKFVSFTSHRLASLIRMNRLEAKHAPQAAELATSAEGTAIPTAEALSAAAAATTPNSLAAKARAATSHRSAEQRPLQLKLHMQQQNLQQKGPEAQRRREGCENLPPLKKKKTHVDISLPKKNQDRHLIQEAEPSSTSRSRSRAKKKEPRSVARARRRTNNSTLRQRQARQLASCRRGGAERATSDKSSAQSWAQQKYQEGNISQMKCTNSAWHCRNAAKGSAIQKRCSDQLVQQRRSELSLIRKRSQTRSVQQRAKSRESSRSEAQISPIQQRCQERSSIQI